MLGDKVLKVFETEICRGNGEPSGSVFSDGNKTLLFATKDGALSIKTLQMEGKKRMSVEEFLRGTKI